MSRPGYTSFKKKALAKPKVRETYEDLAPAYAFRKKLIVLRKRAGLTQEELARRLSTNKSNISRLESVDSGISPKLSTITAYAEALGYQVKIDFVPKKDKKSKK